MDYNQLDHDLHHLLLTSQVISEHEQECDLIQRAGETINKTVKARQWLADMIRWGQEDAQAFIDWMVERNPRPVEIDDDRPSAFARIAGELSRERDLS